MTRAFVGMPDEGLAFLEDLDSLWVVVGGWGGGGGSARTRPVSREIACIR